MTRPREPGRLVRWLARRAASVYDRIDRAGPPWPAGPVLVLANHPNALRGARRRVQMDQGGEIGSRLWALSSTA